MKTSILIATFAAALAAQPALAAKAHSGSWYTTSDGVQSGNSAAIAGRNGLRLSDAVESVRYTGPAGRIWSAEAAESVRVG